MQILKIGLLFAASTLSRLLAGLVIVKIIAVYVGANGLGQLGQFMSLVAIITTLAGGGISTGIVKYVAEFKDEPKELRGYLGAASLITIIASLTVGTILFVCAHRISSGLFGSSAYTSVIRILSVAQFGLAAINLLMGLLNGHKKVRAFAAINVGSVLIGTIGMIVGCALFGMTGAMYGLIWMPVCALLLLLPWYRIKMGWHWEKLKPAFDRTKVRKLMGFGLMLLVTATTMQMSQVVIRHVIETQSGWSQVGYWQAVVKVSDAYLQFITVVLANYFLPRLAELSNNAQLRREVSQAYRLAIPLLLAMTVGIYMLREQIIPIIFSKAFLPMKDFFIGQLIGDFFKVAAYIVGYVAVARASTKIYIGAEILQSGLFVGISYILIGRFGAIGATFAYGATYIIYFVVAYTVYRLYLVRAD